MEEALSLLDEGAFEAFVGAQESQTVEFKREPYRLDDDNQKFELAKDVAGLANGPRGVLIIGLATQQRPDSPLDVVASVRTIERDTVDEDQYSKVIDSRVYPRIKGLAVRFFPSAEDDQRGLVAISVPPQADADKYFLVARPLAEGGAPGWLVAIPLRSLDRVEAMSLEELHSLINRGLTLGDRIDGLAAAVAGLAGEQPPTAQEPTPAERLDERIDQREAELEGPPEQIA
jgi:hypothetical protein